MACLSRSVPFWETFVLNMPYKAKIPYICSMWYANAACICFAKYVKKCQFLVIRWHSMAVIFEPIGLWIWSTCLIRIHIQTKGNITVCLAASPFHCFKAKIPYTQYVSCECNKKIEEHINIQWCFDRWEWQCGKLIGHGIDRCECDSYGVNQGLWRSFTNREQNNRHPPFAYSMWGIVALFYDIRIHISIRISTNQSMDRSTHSHSDIRKHHCALTCFSVFRTPRVES